MTTCDKMLFCTFCLKEGKLHCIIKLYCQNMSEIFLAQQRGFMGKLTQSKVHRRADNAALSW